MFCLPAPVTTNRSGARLPQRQRNGLAGGHQFAAPLKVPLPPVPIIGPALDQGLMQGALFLHSDKWAHVANLPTDSSLLTSSTHCPSQSLFIGNSHHLENFVKARVQLERSYVLPSIRNTFPTRPYKMGKRFDNYLEVRVLKDSPPLDHGGTPPARGSGGSDR